MEQVPPAMKHFIGSNDIVLITLDTLRFDVAQRAFQQGLTTTFAQWLPETGWERRHSPGNFTYASHHAFFAGYLPTPYGIGPHPRLMAAKFPGSESIGNDTFEFDEANVVAALANRGYRTVCIGGVGFFNKQTALGQILPNLFDESHWSPELGVACRESTQNQVALAIQILENMDREQRVFLFLNVSAMHQPNYFYLDGASEDSADSQLAALAYADRVLRPLFDTLQSRGSAFCIVCSDHGTAYGESGYHGHRLNHQVVGDVPYAEFFLPPTSIGGR